MDAGSNQVPWIRKGARWGLWQPVSTAPPAKVRASHWKLQFPLRNFRGAFSTLAAQRDHLQSF